MLLTLTNEYKELAPFMDAELDKIIEGCLNQRINEVGLETAYKEVLHYLDCSRKSKDGKYRLMQTIGLPYRIEMTKAAYIIATYEYGNVQDLYDIHLKNIYYEIDNPCVIYRDKRPSNLAKEKPLMDKPKKEKKEKKTKEQIKSAKLAAKIGSFNFTIKI